MATLSAWPLWGSRLDAPSVGCSVGVCWAPWALTQARLWAGACSVCTVLGSRTQAVGRGGLWVLPLCLGLCPSVHSQEGGQQSSLWTRQHVTLSSCRALTPHLGCSDAGIRLAHTFTFPLLTVPPREHLRLSPGPHYRQHDRPRPPSTSCSSDWMGTVMVKSIPTTLYPPRPLSRTRGQTCICLLTLSWCSSFALGSQRSLCSRGLPTPGLTRN